LGACQIEVAAAFYSRADARPGACARSVRSARAELWLVHRRLRRGRSAQPSVGTPTCASASPTRRCSIERFAVEAPRRRAALPEGERCAPAHSQRRWSDRANALERGAAIGLRELRLPSPRG
jgi:hypothetical protein